jgi:hypothetical protein
VTWSTAAAIGWTDVPELLCLRAAVNEHLTFQFAKGFWSRGLRQVLRYGNLSHGTAPDIHYVGRYLMNITSLPFSL